MSDWTAGYVADVGYTYHYYSELNPVRAVMPLLGVGVAPPTFQTACELGFGQGISVNIHAAASPVQWWGTDFMPDQAGLAQEMARAAGSGATLLDESFAEFCHRPDLPEFDFIAMHGVWSWVSDENRALLVDFVRRKLKVGGVLYTSYNVQPGWAAMVPVRHLMAEYARTMGAPGQPLVQRIDAALDFGDRLIALNPGFVRANPQVRERFKQLRQQERNYLAHEYFNANWATMPFSDVAKWLAPAKVNFACSAVYLNQVDALSIPPDAVEFVNTIPDPVLRETVRDHFLNTQFRRDYWVKGPRRLSPAESWDRLSRERVLLVRPADEVPMHLASPSGGEAKLPLQESIFRPLVDALADRRPHRVSDVAAAVAAKGVPAVKLTQALLILSSRADITFLQDDAAQAAAQPRADALNGWFASRARLSSDFTHLASPATGGGVSVPRFHQMFLAAWGKGAKTAPELASAVWKQLSAAGQKITRDGRPLETEGDNVAYLNADAQRFLQRQLPLLQSLKVSAAAA